MENPWSELEKVDLDQGKGLKDNTEGPAGVDYYISITIPMCTHKFLAYFSSAPFPHICVDEKYFRIHHWSFAEQVLQKHKRRDLRVF